MESRSNYGYRAPLPSRMAMRPRSTLNWHHIVASLSTTPPPRCTSTACSGSPPTQRPADRQHPAAPDRPHRPTTSALRRHPRRGRRLPAPPSPPPASEARTTTGRRPPSDTRARDRVTWTADTSPAGDADRAGSRVVGPTPTFAGQAGTAAGDEASVTVKVYAGATVTGSPVQTLTATPNGAGAYTTSASPLADGTYTAQAEQEDTADNTGTSSPTTFSVDTPRRTRRSTQGPPLLDNSPDGDLHVPRERARLDLRLPARRRRLQRLHQPQELQRPHRRLPHLPSPRHRPRRQHRPHPRQLHLDDRHHRPRHLHRLQPAVADELAVRRPSPSSPARPAPPSPASSTAAATAPAPAPRATAASPTAPTPSRCAPPTPPATPTPPPPPSPGRSTRPPRTRRSTPIRPTPPPAQPRPSRSSASEPGSTFACQLDGGGYSACTSPKSYSGLADGSHTFQVRATDPAGNTDPTPASFTWTIDTARARARRSTRQPARSLGAARRASFTLPRPARPARRFECQLDGGGYSACTSPKSYSGLADGTHTFQVRATDTAGNTDPTPATFTWTSTRARRTRRSTRSPPSLQQRRRRPSPSRERARLDLRLPARRRRLQRLHQPQELQRPHRRLPHLPGARHRPGRQHRPHPRQLHLDDRHDRARHDDRLQARPTRPTAPTATLHASRERARLHLRLPARRRRLQRLHQPQELQRPRRRLPHLPGARHRPGRQHRPHPRQLHLDDRHGRPEHDDRPQPADPSTSTTRQLQLLASEPGSTFACQLDGGGYSACTSPKSYSGLADGSHTFYVRATDPAGNTDPTPASFTWTIDTAAPTRRSTPARRPTRRTRPRPSPSRQRGRLHLRLPARRRRLQRLHQPQELQRPRRRLPHLPGARHRPRRQHRPHPRQLHLDDRHDTPQVTLTQPANGTSTGPTPTFAGQAGTAAGDETSVTVKVYAGATVTGSPVQTLTATPNGAGAYTTGASPLADGTYTAQAEQDDTANNTGTSTPTTFSVSSAPPPTSTYRAMCSRTSPSAYWRLGEASGTVAADEAEHEQRRLPKRGHARPDGRAPRRCEHGRFLRRRQRHRQRAPLELPERDHRGHDRGLGQALQDRRLAEHPRQARKRRRRRPELRPLAEHRQPAGRASSATAPPP